MSNFTRYAEARMRGKIHGQDCINVIHFGTTAAAATQEDLIELLNELGTKIIQCAILQLLGATTSDYTLLGCDVQQLHPVLSDPIEVGAAANSVGLRGTVNASFECWTMRKKTGFGGKTKRGRNFYPPPGDADIVNSLVTGDPVNDFIQGFLTCLVNEFIGANRNSNWQMVILSAKTLKDNPGNFNLATTDVNFLSFEPAITHMASRKVGHGA